MRARAAEDLRAPDLRAAALGVAAWAGAWTGVSILPRHGAVLLAAAALVLWRTRSTAWTRGLAVAVVAGWLCGTLRAEGTAASQVAAWAEEGAVAHVEIVVTGDPRVVDGRFGPVVLTRAVVVEARARGRSTVGRAPVLVRTAPEDASPVLGERLRGVGRLSAMEGRDLAGMLSPASPLEQVATPDVWWRGAADVRAGVRAATDPAPPGPRGLVPALVDGDDARLPGQVDADFRTTGLTHLLAVSGTNLTLVCGFLVAVARLVGVRGRGLVIVAATGIVGFILLARGEPSVLRAAAMGTVGLVALGASGRDQGSRAWGVAVGVLVMIDPWLARSPGFALSALATAGILWWAPRWRDALQGWIPRWLAEAVAVSSAAQLACTPVVAALSGEVSLTAVAANLLAGPVVGVATVAGLAGGLAHLVLPAAGVALGWVACLAAAWIIGVATHTAALPTPAVPWPTGPVGIAALTLLCLALAVAAPRVLARRRAGVVVALIAAVAVLVPPAAVPRLPGAGGTVEGWRIVQCDVGQGDALLLRVAPDAAIVVDVGSEPDAVTRCLRALDIARVPRVVLSHFHDDHVGGLAGVLEAVPVGEVLVSSLAAPASGSDQVRRLAAAAGVRVRVPAYGETGRDGRVRWQVIGPTALGPGSPVSTDSEDSTVSAASGSAELDGSTVNDASLVVLADIGGPGGAPVRILLTGDVEPGAQAGLARAVGTLDVDVLKVPHHGSAHQDHAWLVGLQPEVALIGVGENDYGHPAAATVTPLLRAGVDVGRTDEDGRLVVLRRDGAVVLVRER